MRRASLGDCPRATAREPTPPAHAAHSISIAFRQRQLANIAQRAARGAHIVVRATLAWKWSRRRTDLRALAPANLSSTEDVRGSRAAADGALVPPSIAHSQERGPQLSDAGTFLNRDKRGRTFGGKNGRHYLTNTLTADNRSVRQLGS